MFITKKHLSRRTVLRGVGAAVALPLLDAMVPASTALAQTAAAPKPRLGFFYFPHGAIMEQWTPAKEGTRLRAERRSSSRSKPFQKQLTVVSNLGNRPGESRAVHALVPATWLSCVHPKESHDAQHGGHGRPDRRPAHRPGHAAPSLEIATAQGHGGGSACERDYGCSYSGTISFRTPTRRCRWRTTRASCSCACSARAIRPQEREFLARKTSSMLDMVSERSRLA